MTAQTRLTLSVAASVYRPVVHAVRREAREVDDRELFRGIFIPIDDICDTVRQEVVQEIVRAWLRGLRDEPKEAPHA